MATLTDEQRALLDQPVHAWATTIRPDGSPHNTIVWVTVDGTDVVFNTAVGRAKERHLRRSPWASVSAHEPGNPFRFLSVSGPGRLELDGAEEMIDRLAKKYLDADTYPYRTPEERRITVRITPERIIWQSGH